MGPPHPSITYGSTGYGAVYIQELQWGTSHELFKELMGGVDLSETKEQIPGSHPKDIANDIILMFAVGVAAFALLGVSGGVPVVICLSCFF